MELVGYHRGEEVFFTEERSRGELYSPIMELVGYHRGYEVFFKEERSRGELHSPIMEVFITEEGRGFHRGKQKQYQCRGAVV